MSEEGPEGRQREIRLTPPPRIGPVGEKLGRRRKAPAPAVRSSSTLVPALRPGRPRWVAPLAFGLLALIAALGVYLLRPKPVGESLAPAATAGESLAPAGAAGEGHAPARERAGSSLAADSRAGSGPAADSRAGSSPVADSRAGSSPAADSRAGASPALGAPPVERVAAPRGVDFGRAMAEGLAAIEAGDLETARAAFARAAALDPASPEPAAGLARLEAAASRIALAERRSRAASMLAAEEWLAAAAEYRAALEIDPTLTFARQGLERAEARAALSERLDFHLGRPERLATDEVASEVEGLLETARGVADAGPRHAAQVAALEDLVARVRLPVRVSLVSDDRTEVTVYQVGRLGTFDRREIELRPGTYTVVGSRAGYRDVRRQLTIEPGRPPEPLEIRCEEKI